jgi:hypothetical protein
VNVGATAQRLDGAQPRDLILSKASKPLIQEIPRERDRFFYAPCSSEELSPHDSSSAGGAWLAKGGPTGNRAHRVHIQTGREFLSTSSLMATVQSYSQSRGLDCQRK